jgi:Ca2+-binding EF-hand superfamily protein
MLFVTPPASAQPDDSVAARPEPSADNRLVLVFLGTTQPVFIRLQVEVDGKAFRTSWDEYVEGLFDQLDADSDGQLSSTEVEQGPWTQFLAGQFDEYAAKTLAFAWDLQPADGSVSPEELAAGLRAIDAALDWRFVQSASASGAAGSRLMEVLDANQDGRLSQPEIASADQRLRRFDLDDDDTLSLEEVQPFRNPFFRRQNLVGAATGDGNSQSASNPFFLIAGRQSTRPLIRALLDRYDAGADSRAASKGDNRLTPGEIGIAPAVFNSFDADGDGRLSARELRTLVELPPVDVDLIVRVGRRDDGLPSVSRARDATHTDSGGDALRLVGGEFPTLMLQNVQIQFAVETPAPDDQQRQAVLSRFQSGDRDNNGYLDAQEAASVGFSRSFPAMDRDNDEKVFNEEVVSFFDSQSEAARSRTVLTLRDNGTELFELIDTSGDARISGRELASIDDRLRVWDADGDGELALGEAVHNYRVALSRGSVDLFGVNARVDPRTREPTTPQGRGPLWFHKMDRNRDGDVTRREFFGPGPAFHRLDADNDGRIDPDEASRDANAG